MSKKIKLEAPTVAVALRQWRKAKGWTRKQAAAHLNVNVRTLESWEYGYRKPPAMNLVEKLWAQKRRGGPRVSSAE